jgi:nicotinamide phosphoribosyltransferase
VSFRPNLILQTDSYKQYHWTMRIHDTTRTYSYLSSRIGAKHPWNTAVGLQYYLKEYLEGPRVTTADIEEALEYLRAHFKYPQLNPMWSHIVETYGGRLPLRILAWDEGSRVPVGYPTFTNTIYGMGVGSSRRWTGTPSALPSRVRPRSGMGSG